MTDTTTAALPDSIAHLVGERIHSLDPSGITIVTEVLDDDRFGFPRTMTLARGQELVLDEKILLASLDRNGENSIWALDEYQQRDRFDGVVRWNFGEYPDSERRFDLANKPDESRLIQHSTVIASYKGSTSSEPDVRGLRPGLRPQW